MTKGIFLVLFSSPSTSCQGKNAITVLVLFVSDRRMMLRPILAVNAREIYQPVAHLSLGEINVGTSQLIVKTKLPMLTARFTSVWALL